MLGFFERGPVQGVLPTKQLCDVEEWEAARVGLFRSHLRAGSYVSTLSPRAAKRQPASTLRFAKLSYHLQQDPPGGVEGNNGNFG